MQATIKQQRRRTVTNPYIIEILCPKCEEWKLPDISSEELQANGEWYQVCKDCAMVTDMGNTTPCKG